MTETERQQVRKYLGDGRVICARCGATLETYGDACRAPLDERCPGFNAIEDALAIAKETP